MKIVILIFILLTTNKLNKRSYRFASDKKMPEDHKTRIFII